MGIAACLAVLSASLLLVCHALPDDLFFGLLARADRPISPGFRAFLLLTFVASSLFFLGRTVIWARPFSLTAPISVRSGACCTNCDRQNPAGLLRRGLVMQRIDEWMIRSWPAPPGPTHWFPHRFQTSWRRRADCRRTGSSTAPIPGYGSPRQTD